MIICLNQVLAHIRIAILRTVCENLKYFRFHGWCLEVFVNVSISISVIVIIEICLDGKLAKTLGFVERSGFRVLIGLINLLYLRLLFDLH